MKHLVQDWNEFNSFVNSVLPALRNDEVFFISLSARKKYLSDEERELYQLAQTEMYQRKVVRSKDNFEYVMNELSANFSVRKTKNGLPMPEKANVVYININPASMVKAVTAFKADMDKELAQIINGLMSEGNPNYDALRYADRKLLNHIQKAKGNRTWIDIDVDSLDTIHTDMLTDSLWYHEVDFVVVSTHGGFHVLVDRESLNLSDCKLHEIVKSLDNHLKVYDKECVFNSNGMVAIPGTLHAGKLVKWYTDMEWCNK